MEAEIKKLLKAGSSRKEISRKLGISEWQVRKVKNGTTHDKPEEIAKDVIISSLRNKVRSLTKKYGNWQILAEQFAGIAAQLPKPKRPEITLKPKSREQEVVALLGDCHAGEKWTKAQTDGMTEYNFEAFCRMLWYYGSEIVNLTMLDRPLYGLYVLHVDMLGDILHGTLRVEDEVTNDMPTSQSIAATAHVIYQWLVGLAERFVRVEVKCVAGNHGRLTKKPENKRYTEENKDTIVYLMIKAMLTASGLDDRIRMRVYRGRTKSFMRLGHKIKIFHGDHIRGGNGISQIPIYGLSRDMLRQMKKELNREGGAEPIKLIECGHFHSYNFLESTFLINGAMAPADVYATEEIGASSTPSQYLYYTSKEYVFGWSMPVSLKAGQNQPHGFTYDKKMLE